MKHIRQMIWIGMTKQIPNLKLSDVEKMNESINGEIIDMFGHGWAIIGDKQAKDNFEVVKSVAEGLKSNH